MQTDDLIAAAENAHRTGDRVRALNLAREAVATDPASGAAQNALGVILSADLEYDAAREAFIAAVSASPATAHYRSNLGFSHILAGDFAEAEAEVRKALALDPALGFAYLNLTWITKASPGDPIIATLEDLKRGASDNDALRSQYCFALGKCYDDIGEYDLAFENFREANDALHVSYDAEAHDRLARAIKQVWTREFMIGLRGAGFVSEKPVFLIGFPRSGSSLLEHRLASHSDVAALGERPEITRISDMITRNHPARAPYPLWAPSLPRNAYAGFGKLYIEKFEKAYPSATRLLDKNLLNFTYAGFIRAMFPSAHIIQCRRNPLDTCLSAYFQNLELAHQYKFGLESLGHYYRFYDGLMAHWRTFIEIEAIDHEALAADPDGETDRAFAMIGVTGARTGAGAKHIQTASAFQARQPVHTVSVGRWKKYEKHLGPLIDALGDLAKV